MSAAAAVVLEGLARQMRPRPPVRVTQWVEDNVVLVDGAHAGRPWRRDGAPYMAEILDCLADDHPCNELTVRKSQQSGASIAALAWLLYISDREPCNVLYAAPNLQALKDLNSGKLQPLIDAWQKKTGRIVIEPLTSRSEKGSTTYEKVYPGGRIWLGNANSLTDLSSKTVKKGVMDELSKWSDLENDADPETLFFGRFTAFRRRKNWKILKISTPEIDSGDIEGDAPGHCRIDRSFRRSDQRFWHVPCPQCREYFVHRIENLAVDAQDPSQTSYACPACGYPIRDAERPAMIRAGEWRATCPGPAREPGFHIDAFISLMMSYEEIGRDYLAAQRLGQTAKKDFANLVLGLPYAYTGNAPDHVRLMERREEGWKRGHVPPRGLILVAAADVQMRGVWVEIVAFAPNRESWVVDAFYVDGETEDPERGAWPQLEALTLTREFPDAFGRKRRLDALGVDSGYRSHVVYSWVRAHQRHHPDTGHNVIFALKGDDGWNKPAIGTPSLVDINLEGRRIKQGVQLWPIGGWPLKAVFYEDLGKVGLRGGAQSDPPGYCHFPDWLDENYFKQITAESLDDETYRGRTRKVWKQRRPDNHFLDARTYCLALADQLGLSRWTSDEIADLAKSRGMPPDDTPPLLRAAALAAPAQAPAEKPKPAESADERLLRLMRDQAKLFS